MPDFGIFRGFGSKLFSDKLYAGQLPTQLGRIGSTDPDAVAFFDRVTTAGGTLSATEQTAINTLVIQMKTDGIWTKMKAIYPMVGASAAACSQNLKSSSFTGTFTSGWTFASTGVTPNGTSAFFNTGLNMLNDLSQNNSHISVYSRTNIDNVKSMIGAANTNLTNAIVLYPRAGNAAYIEMFTSGGGNIGVASQNNSLGLRILSRIISTSFQYFNNTTKTNLNNTSVSGANFNIYVGANNVNGTASAFDTRQNAFTSLGEGLTDTEASNFYTAVQAFQTTLNRQV